MPTEDFANMERAEDLFQAYGVSYDPRVLTVWRLPLLRRFGIQVAKLTEHPVGPDERRRLMAAELAEAHEHFARGGKPELRTSAPPLVNIRPRPPCPEL